MLKRRLLKMRENGRYLSFKHSSLLVHVSFLMHNIFCFLFSFCLQGSDKVRDIPWPEELVFTVDQKIINEIGHAKELYYKKVGFLAPSLNCLWYFLFCSVSTFLADLSICWRAGMNMLVLNRWIRGLAPWLHFFHHWFILSILFEVNQIVIFLDFCVFSFFGMTGIWLAASELCLYILWQNID